VGLAGRTSLVAVFDRLVPLPADACGFYLDFLETHVDIYICRSIYFYIYVHYNFINTSEKLSRFNLEIHEVDYQKRLTTGTSSPTERIISRKYNSRIGFITKNLISWAKLTLLVLFGLRRVFFSFLTLW
jgi:hypothetical protein